MNHDNQKRSMARNETPPEDKFYIVLYDGNSARPYAWICKKEAPGPRPSFDMENICKRSYTIVNHENCLSRAMKHLVEEHGGGRVLSLYVKSDKQFDIEIKVNKG